MRVFISHSSNDVEVARLLIDLLQKALPLSNDEIRCTSVDGYRMQAGVRFDEELRAEVCEAELLIGLITPDAVVSDYVRLELGARWGSHKPMILLLASGATVGHLRGPLAGINALDARENGQVHQLLENAADYLGGTLGGTSSYEAAVNKLVQESSRLVTIGTQQPATAEYLQLSEEARDLLLPNEATRGSGNKGTIVMVRSFAGLVISTNSKNLVEGRDARAEAKWREALSVLQSEGLVEDVTGKGTVFTVTNRGYEVAYELAKS